MTTILHKLHENARSIPDKPAYYEKVNGTWEPTNWADYTQQVRQAGRALVALGMDKGNIVSILGFNKPEWVIVDLAGMLIGGAAAGIYTTNSPGEVQYIAHHAESKVMLIEDAEQWAKIEQERENLPHLQHVVMMRGADKPDDPMVLSWEEFLAKAEDVSDEEIDRRMEGLEPEQLATLIYTSGTTGPPKGVMLSHNNLVWTAQMGQDMVATGPGDSSLSYLPLSHIAEQMFTIHTPITAGYSIYFAEGPLAVADNLKEVQPTVIFGVPRVWERFYSGVTARLAEATGVRASLVNWARGTSSKVVALQNQGEEPTGMLATQSKLANKLVLSKIYDALGLSNARIIISGAAPIPVHILEFFATLGLRVHEIYGQSEGTGPTTFNMPNATKFGSVGTPIPGMEVKISDEGEIVVDGWLQSGDLGEFDDDGFLHITGRKKDIIITSGGKNVAPKNLEAALLKLDLVSSAVCIGEGQRYLTALLTLEPDAAQRFADENGLSVEGLHEQEAVRTTLQAGIEKEVNPEFARVEQIRNFRVLANDFSVETGELTPTFKIKRSVVNEMYAGEIEKV